MLYKKKFSAIFYLWLFIYDDYFCRNSLWPDGVRATEVQFRDAEVQLRTLVAAKCALMSSVSGKPV